MRIAFVVGQFPSLSETFILHQITGLLDRGHDVHIFARRAGDSKKVHPEVTSYGLKRRTTYYRQPPAQRLHRLLDIPRLFLRHGRSAPVALLRTLNGFRHGWKPSLRLFYRATSMAEREAWNYDIVHCHFGHNGIDTSRLREAGLLTGKVIVTFHGYDINVFPRMHDSSVYDELFSSADLFTANSRFTASKLENLGCLKEKIVLLPMGLRVPNFCFAERSLASGEAVRLLTVARLTGKKGLEYAIRAVANLARRHPRVEYDIVGDGPLRQPLEHLAREVAVASKVHFWGWKTWEEMQSLWRQAHIFLLPSVTAEDGDAEGQGLVLQEAQAAGLPVVATLHNGFPDSVIDGKSAFLVPERDVEALVERLGYLIDNPGVWPEMGRCGNSFVKENFDVDVLNERLERLYLQLLKSDTGRERGKQQG